VWSAPGLRQGTFDPNAEAERRLCAPTTGRLRRDRREEPTTRRRAERDERPDEPVLAQGHDPDDGLLTVLTGAGAFDGEVHAIGDCLAPRTVEEGVLEGLRVASAI
jgi:hypothetical protein